MDKTILISVIGALVVLTNLIVQVLKQVTYNKIPTNILVVIISLLLVIGSVFAYCEINVITMTWYMIAASVVVGIMVAYAAMFGFDKLREALKQIDKMTK